MLHETLEYLGIAFISSVLLIIMSKIILQALIRRPADYYNARELMEEELMLNAGGISITKEHETNPEGEIIEEKHLEAQLGDSEAAKPEEIMLEIPDAVAESIEVHKEEEAEAAEPVPEPEPESEPEPIEEPEPEEALEEPAAETPEEPAEAIIEEPEPEVVEEPEPEPEPEPEVVEEPKLEPEQEPAAEEVAEETPEEKQEPEEPKTPEETFGFSIRAKTSRTRKPKRKEEEEAAEELEEAKAAMDEAKAKAAESEAASEWSESYAEIRDSLEKAFTERRRKPSMHMNKKELTEIAIGMGIELPNKVTKREILDLINEAAE